uniref:Transposase MuDR plant domain-containing protein n=1 Tax=Arundo donax TaxID=35708 RepID=A0A0A9D7Z0_ARUDO
MVAWSNLGIEPRDEEGRVVPVSDDAMYVLLGLREEDERNKQQQGAGTASNVGGTDRADGAAIVVDDSILEEQYIFYDKDNSQFYLDAKFPTMTDFRMALRQYAINEEFDMGTEKSDKTRFRGFCNGEGYGWRIVGHIMPDNRTIRVTKISDEHDCTSSSRIRTSMASQAWVADKAIHILRKTPNIGTKELQKQLQDEHNVTIS